ncbi:MAG: PorT family protein [Bacteroidales bacterium]|nr:PorT family protein [Bacteroidales bacterium]
MKNFYISILFILSVLTGFTQKSRPMNLERLDMQIAHFGYSLGLNMMDFTVRPSDFSTSPLFDTIYGVEIGRYVGFNVNMIANLRLGKHFDLRFLPGLNFGQRGLHYKLIKYGEFQKRSMMIESTYIDLPLLIKYKAVRINNWRPFLIGGIDMKIDLAAQKKIKAEDMPKIRLKATDAYYELGLGADFFLEYFMFGIEIKASWGIRNIVDYDNSQFTSYYKRLNSRMVHISFHFEGGKIDKLKWWKN